MLCWGIEQPCVLEAYLRIIYIYLEPDLLPISERALTSGTSPGGAPHPTSYLIGGY